MADSTGKRLALWIAQCHRQPDAPLWWRLLTALPCWGYAVIVAIRNTLYDLGWLAPIHLPIPVISVGNLTTGGTGKTPMVIALARHLVKQGNKVVILSRGYGAREPQTYARPDNPAFGDEPYLIQQVVPQAIVIVGRDRKANALRAMAEHQPDVVILDDGFQYRGLARTVDMVLVDAQSRLGNGYLLPTGPLREPVSSLKRSHCLMLTRWPGDDLSLIDATWLNHLWQASPLLREHTYPVPIQPVGLRAESNLGELLELTGLNRRDVIAVSGIAQPAQFEQALTTAGAVVRSHLTLADHHDYTVVDIERLTTLINQWPQAWLITTGKDAVKLFPLLSSVARWSTHCFILEIAPILPADFLSLYLPTTPQKLLS